MKKGLRFIAIAICALAFLVGLVACNGSTTIDELRSEYGVIVSGGGFDENCKLISEVISLQGNLANQILDSIRD